MTSDKIRAYLAFVVCGFFEEVDLTVDDAVSVECRDFTGDLLLVLSLEEDVEHRDARDFSSIEFNEDC